MLQIENSKAVSILTRITLFAGLWWIIAQGRTDAWIIGLPAVALAATASIGLCSDALPRLSIIGLFRFIVLFMTESIRGGIDVARRTLTPELRIQPGFSRYRMALDDPHARVLLINCISLLPGTLSSSIDGDYVELHLLDMRQDPVSQLQRLEQSIANIFRLRLENMNA
jgi:multicomponent Na+:H+ antiporter subunit E